MNRFCVATIVLLCAMVGCSMPPVHGVSPRSAVVTANATSRVKSMQSKPAADPLLISDEVFAYREFDKDVPPDVRTLYLKKTPIQFAVETSSNDTLADKSVDITVQIKQLDGTVVFERYWTSVLKYREQRDAIIFHADTYPAELNALLPGRYKLYWSIGTPDGVAFAQNETIISAQ